MAKSTKPRSTAPSANTTPRATRARKPDTTFETAIRETASDSTTLETTTPAALPHDMVAMRAYELYLDDGAPQGRDVEHWLRAETELRERASRN